MGTLQQQLLVLITTPLYVIIIGAEIVISHIHHTRSYSWRETLHNFGLSICGGLVDALMRGVSLVILTFFFNIHLFSLSHSIAYWVILLLLVDLMHYWLHRLSHTCRLFWAVHVNHHSSVHFNLSVAFRAGVLEPLYRFLFFVPLCLPGFQPVDILLVYSITEIWVVFTHTEKIKKLGWLEYILVTPSHHRVHHASNIRYLDKNMSNVFIIWDRLFGTFQKELPADEYEAIRYGVLSPPMHHHLPAVIFHEWAAIWKDVARPNISFYQTLRYIFGPPGWSHDGSRRTSDELRRQDAQLHQQPPITKT